MSAYRYGKEKFEKVTTYLQELENRCLEVQRVLDPLPTDYVDAGHPREVAELQQKLILIGDAFEDLGDTANREREKFREQARKGQFTAIRDVPDRLLNPIHSQLHPVGGALQKMENTIQEYRDQKRMAVNDILQQALSPLFSACGESAPQPVLSDQIKGLSLHDMQIHLDMLMQIWEQKAGAFLSGTGLDVAGWIALARAIANGENPALDPAIQEQLVRKGILKVRLAFGGTM